MICIQYETKKPYHPFLMIIFKHRKVTINDYTWSVGRRNLLQRNNINCKQLQIFILKGFRVPQMPLQILYRTVLKFERRRLVLLNYHERRGNNHTSQRGTLSLSLSLSLDQLIIARLIQVYPARDRSWSTQVEQVITSRAGQTPSCLLATARRSLFLTAIIYSRFFSLNQLPKR